MPKKFNIARWAWILGLLLTTAGMCHSAQAKDMSWGAINDANRFQVLQNFGGAAVLDRETGLIWQKSPGPAGPLTEGGWVYSDGLVACMQVNTGGRFGWRVPTFEELISLRTNEKGIEGDDSLALPAGHPFQNVNPFNHYWTTTTDPGSSSVVMGFAFAKSCDAPASTVCFQTNSKTASGQPVWCVRSGPSHFESGN